MRVWREGDRIRQEDGSGYADIVSDVQVAGHAKQAHREAREAAGVAAFADAVLAFRAGERSRAASQEREGTG